MLTDFFVSKKCYNGVTMKLTIHEIAQVVGAKNDWSQLADLSVNKIEFDSRLIEKGDIFLPLKGTRWS